jgi:hypothetical protein
MAESNNNSEAVTLNLKQLSLFKNGFAFVVRKVEKLAVESEDTGVSSVTILHPPNSPVLGTLWTDLSEGNIDIYSPSTGNVLGFETFSSTRPVIRDCTELEELIQANIGNEVQLKIMEGKSVCWIQGKLLTVKRNKSTIANRLLTPRGVTS